MSENSAIKPLLCPISKDENCSICLEKITNRACTSTCLHSFCFICLLQWSKVKWECPLCKAKFNRIFHNIRNNKDYEVLHNVIAVSEDDVLGVEGFQWDLDIDTEDTDSIFSLMDELFHETDSESSEGSDAITDDEYDEEEEYDDEDGFDDEDEEEYTDDSCDDEDEQFQDEEDDDDEFDEETDDEYDDDEYEDEEYDEDDEEAEEEEYDDDGSLDSWLESYDEEEMEEEEYDQDQEMHDTGVGAYDYISDNYDEISFEMDDYTWNDYYE